MSKLRVFCIAVGIVSAPVYFIDAKVNGVWDSGGILLTVGLVVLVLLEPPVALMVRGYFARKKAREEREERERALAERRSMEAEIRKKRLEREAAAQKLAEQAEREANRRKADETWNQRQKSAFE